MTKLPLTVPPATLYQTRNILQSRCPFMSTEAASNSLSKTRDRLTLTLSSNSFRPKESKKEPRKMDDPNGLPESEKLIDIAANLLCDGDFSGCRKFAVIASDFDPINPVTQQLLAVADVMLADPTDWCSVLQLTRPDSENLQLIRFQCAKLAGLLDPKVNCFPYSDEALRVVKRAWFELSKNTRVGNPEQEETEGNFEKSEEGFAGETFWTVCPFCYAMFEYKKEFEDCCLRCQVCRRAFQGVAIKPPAPEIMVKGKEQYYFAYGCFEMKYYDVEKTKKDTDGNKKKDEGIATVEISDDEEEQKNVSGVVKFWSEGNLPAKRMKAKARRVKGTKSKLKMATTNKRMGDGNVKDWDLNGEFGNEIGDGEMGEVRFF